MLVRSRLLSLSYRWTLRGRSVTIRGPPQALTSLQGVGPVTASALLCRATPQRVAYMSDEAPTALTSTAQKGGGRGLGWLVWGISIYIYIYIVYIEDV